MSLLIFSCCFCPESPSVDAHHLHSTKSKYHLKCSPLRWFCFCPTIHIKLPFYCKHILLFFSVFLSEIHKMPFFSRFWRVTIRIVKNKFNALSYALNKNFTGIIGINRKIDGSWRSKRKKLTYFVGKILQDHPFLCVDTHGEYPVFLIKNQIKQG